jgi:hypothetical protein
MSLFSKLGKLFGTNKMPDEAKSAFTSAKDTRELMKNLDGLITRNQVEIKTIEKEMLKLGTMEEEEAEKVRAGKLPDVVKRIVLRTIKRLRKQIQNVEDRLSIFDKNINLHLNLIGKIQQMEAMQLRGVSENEIDDVIMDFEANFEAYTAAIEAGADMEAHVSKIESDEAELDALEKEVLGEKERATRDKELDDLEKEIMETAPKKEEPPEEEGLIAE